MAADNRKPINTLGQYNFGVTITGLNTGVTPSVVIPNTESTQTTNATAQK